MVATNARTCIDLYRFTSVYRSIKTPRVSYKVVEGAQRLEAADARGCDIWEAMDIQTERQQYN